MITESQAWQIARNFAAEVAVIAREYLKGHRIACRPMLQAGSQ